MIDKIKIYLIGIFAAALFFLKTYADKMKRQRDDARDRARNAETVNELHRDINIAAEKLNQQHTQEKKHVQTSLENGARDQLDNDW